MFFDAKDPRFLMIDPDGTTAVERADFHWLPPFAMSEPDITSSLASPRMRERRTGATR
jgi:hypothetical protein